MKIAFIIDKTQTFQTIAGVLCEALAREHECTLFCNFFPQDLGSFLNTSPRIIDSPNLKWVQHPNKEQLIQKLSSSRKDYNAVVGINLFNKSWTPLYQNNQDGNYSLEYCWNEIYNQQKPFSSNTVLFCNTGISKKIISDLSSYTNLESIGSPWLELISSCKKPPKKEKNKVITVLAPHNSFFIKSPNLGETFAHMLHSVRGWCDKNNAFLSYKTRDKYKNKLKWEGFDFITSDKSATDHIDIYASSDVVVNFCSSAINELAFLKVPYLCVGNDLQKQLHTNRNHHLGIQKLHQAYYSGDIFDGIHCDVLDSREMKSDALIQKIENLIKSQKDWKSFQSTYFPGNHEGASARIMDRIEEDNAKSKQASGNDK